VRASKFEPWWIGSHWSVLPLDYKPIRSWIQLGDPWNKFLFDVRNVLVPGRFCWSIRLRNAPRVKMGQQPAEEKANLRNSSDEEAWSGGSRAQIKSEAIMGCVALEYIRNRLARVTSFGSSLKLGSLLVYIIRANLEWVGQSKLK